MPLNTSNLLHVSGILLTVITLDYNTGHPCSFMKKETDLKS